MTSEIMNNKMKILLAFDGSQYAEDAIENLLQAGLPNDVEATVLTVTDAWELPETIEPISSRSRKFIHPGAEVIQDHLTQIKAQAQTLVNVAVRRLSEIFPSWYVFAEERFGKPAWEIIEKADEWQADLIVVGSHGRSALGRVLLGSVSQKVLNEARCSVRIARKSPENKIGRPVRILMAVDGSKYAEAAVKTVAARRWAEDVEVRLVAVDDPFTHPAAGYVFWNLKENKPEDTEEAQAWIEKVIETPTKILQEAGLKNISHAVKWGDAGNMILHEAEEWQADTIFMGARGLGRFQRFWLGSVSSTVATRAHCSVEVVRFKERD